jgi:molybdopterin converting factor small subunit
VERAISVDIHLFPPLSNTAHRDKVTLTLKEGATLQTVIDALLKRFDNPAFRLHLYDTEGRLIPAWSAFINDRPAVRLGIREGPATPVSDGDDITFILGLAGG